MIITKFCYFNGRKYRYLTVGILLIGNFLGLFLVMNINNIQVLQVSSYDNESQKGNHNLISSKTASIKENFNGHAYLLIEEFKTWNDAKIDCESLGGYLVTISSQSENDFVANLMVSDEIWIGFTDESIEGSWEWVTGESVTYTNWSQDEPNDDGDGEDNAEMSSSGYWNDYEGPSYLLNYVCEIDTVEVLDAPRIDFPNGGEILDGKITIEWRKAVDPQGHSISYSVFYSSDNGSTWVSFDMSGLVEGFEIMYCYLDWDTSTLLHGTNFLLKVIATCSFGGEAEDITDNFFTIHYVTKPTSITINYNTNSEGIINIVWSPSVDSLGQNITYSVYYSSDAGNNWILLASGLTDTHYEWNTTTVSDGRTYRIKVVSTSFDGLSTENILFGMLTIDNIQSDNTFLIIGLAVIAIFPEFYIFRKLQKFVKYLIFKEGVETP